MMIWVQWNWRRKQDPITVAAEGHDHDEDAYVDDVVAAAEAEAGDVVDFDLDAVDYDDGDAIVAVVVAAADAADDGWRTCLCIFRHTHTYTQSHKIQFNSHDFTTNSRKDRQDEEHLNVDVQVVEEHDQDVVLGGPRDIHYIFKPFQIVVLKFCIMNE